MRQPIRSRRYLAIGPNRTDTCHVASLRAITTRRRPDQLAARQQHRIYSICLGCEPPRIAIDWANIVNHARGSANRARARHKGMPASHTNYIAARLEQPARPSDRRPVGEHSDLRPGTDSRQGRCPRRAVLVGLSPYHGRICKCRTAHAVRARPERLNPVSPPSLHTPMPGNAACPCRRFAIEIVTGNFVRGCHRLLYAAMDAHQPRLCLLRSLDPPPVSGLLTNVLRHHVRCHQELWSDPVECAKCRASAHGQRGDQHDGAEYDCGAGDWHAGDQTCRRRRSWKTAREPRRIIRLELMYMPRKRGRT